MSKYYGYWNDILQDNELLSNYEQILEELYDGTSVSAMDYLHGYCTHFAYQLARRYNLPIIVVKDYEGNLIHAYCKYTDEDSQTWLLDIRGATIDYDKFFDEFEVDWRDDDWYSFDFFGPASLNKFYNRYITSKNMMGEEDSILLRDAITFIENMFKQ